MSRNTDDFIAARPELLRGAGGSHLVYQFWLEAVRGGVYPSSPRVALPRSRRDRRKPKDPTEALRIGLYLAARLRQRISLACPTNRFPRYSRIRLRA